MITNEVPATILQAYISVSGRIRKDVLRRRIIGPYLGTAVGCQQFHKESRKHQTRIMKVIISFSIIICCLVVA